MEIEGNSQREIFKKSRQERKRLLDKNEKEIEKLKLNLKNNIQLVRNDHNIQLDQIKRKNNSRMLKEIQNKTSRLDSALKSLSETKTKISAEENRLVSAHKIHLEEKNNMQDDKLINFRAENIKKINELTKKSKVEDRNIKDRANNDISVYNMDANNKIQDAQYHSIKKMRERKREFDFLLDRQERDFKGNYAAQELKNTQTKNVQERQNNIKLLKLKKQHEKEIENFKKISQDKLLQLRERLDKYYSAIVNNHNQNIGGIRRSTNNYFLKVKHDLAEDKMVFDKKQNDEFYHIKTISPTLYEDDKKYIVSLPVERYERENVHLTADKRTLRLSLTRRFEDKIVTDLGDKNTTKRSETYSKSFQVKDIMDPSQVTKNYVNGILSFAIPKL